MKETVPIAILGGGIHGVGVLHDLCSRGFRNVHLFEKGFLANGTSSKSTKLIHGGLRYLERPSQMHLVYECLHERQLLLDLAPDLVRPLELLIPIEPNVKLENWKVKIGLTLYDFLAGKALIQPHRLVSKEEALKKVPLLKNSEYTRFFSYWDAQTDDKSLVERVAASAEALGAHIREGQEALRVEDKGELWKIDFSDASGKRETFEARFVINCLGPWSNNFLESSGLTPTHKGYNNKGVHLLTKSLGLSSGMLLRALDKRVFFILPWKGKTLIGTTEEDFARDPDSVGVTTEDIQYLLKSCSQSIGFELKETDIESSFAGLRWLAVEEGKNLSRTSRESVWGTIKNQNGFILTLYGGKLTSYRKLCEKIGDFVSQAGSYSTRTQTHLRKSWVSSSRNR